MYIYIYKTYLSIYPSNNSPINTFFFGCISKGDPDIGVSPLHRHTLQNVIT